MHFTRCVIRNTYEFWTIEKAINLLFWIISPNYAIKEKCVTNTF